MATTIPAVMTQIFATAATNNCVAWDAIPPGPPLTAAQRATVITAILAGTVASEANALALIATAATGGVSQKQVWDVMRCNPPTSG